MQCLQQLACSACTPLHARVIVSMPGAQPVAPVLEPLDCCEQIAEMRCMLQPSMGGAAARAAGHAATGQSWCRPGLPVYWARSPSKQCRRRSAILSAWALRSLCAQHTHDLSPHQPSSVAASPAARAAAPHMLGCRTHRSSAIWSRRKPTAASGHALRDMVLNRAYDQIDGWCGAGLVMLVQL